MPPTTHGLVGICLAIHGIVNQENITFTPYYDLEHIDLVSPLVRNTIPQSISKMKQI